MNAAHSTTAFGPAEDFVNAYESVRARESVPIKAFLPPRDDPRFLTVLAELIRVEMEYAWGDGRPMRLAAYRAEFPELFAHPSVLAPVAFEEYRLRRQSGELVSRDEYSSDYGVDTSLWPEESGSVSELSQRLAETETQFPDVGDTVAGFRLERELGRGAFGRVYLARQGDLADRPVALKVAADVGTESRTLARLQHTNVMPVYSVHRTGPFQAVCMPFFPAVTLADLCRSLSKRNNLPESGQALLETLRARTALAGQVVGSDPSAPDPAPAAVKANLDLLAGVSFVKAVVWIGARLADGLAHAHERGIVHRDLKPANVLLTDEGQPLILDFNLAADINPTAAQARAALGGTLPYMPPEHLQAFRDRRPFRDPRGDVYALGLILYELLAGRHPFPIRRGDPERVLPDMIADRQSPPGVRTVNRSVPRGLESILCKCMDADPARRYPTARELHEDLQRQFDDQPLVYAREPLLERLGKWRRLHPRLTSWGTVGALTACLLLTAGVVVRRALDKQEQARHERELVITRETARDFHVQFENVHIRSDLPTPVAAIRPTPSDQMQRFRDDWAPVFDANLYGPPWTEALSPDDLNRLRREVADTYYLLAEELTRDRNTTPPDRWRQAVALYDQAINTYPPGELPRAVWIRKLEAHRKLGEERSADRAAAEVRRIRVKPGHDRLWTARELLEQAQAGFAGPDAQRRRDEAERYLEEAVLNDPNDPLIHAYLAYVKFHTRPDSAAEHYGLSIGLYPVRVPGADLHPPDILYHFRALAYYQAGRYEEAVRDFGVMIDKRSDFLDAYVNRALALEKEKKYPAALSDLDHVLARTPDRTDVLFQRARVRRLAGDRAGAAADHTAGLTSTPTTARGWNARSYHQSTAAAALADVNEAIELHPRGEDERDAYQHKAHVLSERLPELPRALAGGGSWLRAAAAAVEIRGREGAIDVLDELLVRRPEFSRARAGRAVLLARDGRDDAALADAKVVVRQERARRKEVRDHLLLYQVAGVYSLVSDRRPAQRAQAMELLKEAFAGDPSLYRHVQTDPELRPLHRDPTFLQLVTAARTLGQ